MLLTFIFKRRIRENRLIKAKTHKTCTGCKAVKPLDKFDKNKDWHVRAKASCKDCKSDHNKARRATPAVKAAVKAANARRKADPVRHAAHLKQHARIHARKHATPEGLVENRCAAASSCHARLQVHLGPARRGPAARCSRRPDSTFNLLGIVSWAALCRVPHGDVLRWHGLGHLPHRPHSASLQLQPQRPRGAHQGLSLHQHAASLRRGQPEKGDKWTEEGHHLRWNGVKWVLKADWELIDENDKYGLNKYQRKVEPAAEPPAKRRKIGIEAYFKAK